MIPFKDKQTENEYWRDVKEVYEPTGNVVVSLPQFVIDRVKPCVDEYENGLTMMGSLIWVDVRDLATNKKLEDDPEWWDSAPIDMPKLTPEFEAWRDETLFRSIRQMKVILALMYRYQLEDVTPGQTSLDLEDSSDED
ncbi:hypothetical protein [Lactiplantibacillus daowaiensis]|uniref:Uncharacterized protein n=1 Tax=Lactiplantibacillus daowaiensis TaxID=2559918 RepID=A0ABW1RXY9_9LACO|nr:hypothetical protein [Lactiplantibacillus daowaiensis]